MRTIHGSSTSMLSPYVNRRAPKPMLRERLLEVVSEDYRKGLRSQLFNHGLWWCL